MALFSCFKDFLAAYEGCNQSQAESDSVHMQLVHSSRSVMALAVYLKIDVK